MRLPEQKSHPSKYLRKHFFQSLTRARQLNTFVAVHLSPNCGVLIVSFRLLHTVSSLRPREPKLCNNQSCRRNIFPVVSWRRLCTMCGGRYLMRKPSGSLHLFRALSSFFVPVPDFLLILSRCPVYLGPVGLEVPCSSFSCHRRWRLGFVVAHQQDVGRARFHQKGTI